MNNDKGEGQFMKNLLRLFFCSLILVVVSMFSMESSQAELIEFLGRGATHIFSTLGAEEEQSKSKVEAKYFFHQQINDMCMIAPMLNLKLLDLMKTPMGTYDLNLVSSYSRREWMALNIPYLLKWHGIIESLNHSTGKLKYPHLITFIENAKQYGPVFPHFYDKEGNFLFSSALGDVFAGTLQVPYFLIDFNAIKRFKLTIFGWDTFSMGDLGPALGLFLPIFKVKNNEQFYIPFVTQEYPHQKVNFESFDLSYNESGDIDLSQFNDVGYGNMGGLTKIIRMQVPFLGFEEALKTMGTGRGYLSNEIIQTFPTKYEKKTIVQGEEKKSEFVTFSLGLYKLMLLTLGIIETQSTYTDKVQSVEESEVLQLREKELANNTIEAQKNIYDCVKNDPLNPWHESYFSKDNFLQHAIATILKENPVLFNQAKAVVDFYFPVWGTYDNYLNRMAQGECFNASNQRYYVNLAKHFLPSEEYVMAYALTQCAWYLSIGGINNAAFYKALTNDTGYLRSFFINVHWSNFKKLAYTKKEITSNEFLSYMEVWKKIVSLLSQYERKSWVSFSGHGMIISFDNDLIQQQKKMPNSDQSLLDELGFAIIDSWLGTELNTFYKK